MIGGELFLTDEWSFCKAWDNLVDAINRSKIETLYLATNLMYDLDRLIDVLFGLKKDVWICTSYDEIGRFRSKIDRFRWWGNVLTLRDMGYKIHCTVIPSQELITGDFEPPDWLHCDLCEPIKSPEWYWSVDKTHYHDELVSCTPVTLPNRKDVLKWLTEHPLITKNYVDQESTHANNIWEFYDNTFKNTYADRFENNLAPCGHQYWSRCYADSDKCMMCDAKTIRG